MMARSENEEGMRCYIIAYNPEKLFRGSIFTMKILCMMNKKMCMLKNIQLQGKRKY